MASPSTGVPIPRWSQCALNTTASDLRSGSLPGISATTFRVSCSWTFDRIFPWNRMPSGIGRNPRDSEAFSSSFTLWPASARKRSPASLVTQAASASAASPGATFT